MTNVKRAMFFVGAVLVLAACDNATAPRGPLSAHDGPAAAVKDSTNGNGNKSTSTSTLMCGYWLPTGDSTWVECDPQ